MIHHFIQNIFFSKDKSLLATILIVALITEAIGDFVRGRHSHRHGRNGRRGRNRGRLGRNFGRNSLGRRGRQFRGRQGRTGGAQLDPNGLGTGYGGPQLDAGGLANGGGEVISGGIDFSGCEEQPDGMCCVFKESSIKSIKKDPILECTHKQIEKCHYTYVTEFLPNQEEVCEENFEKKCQITFKKMSSIETVKKCYTPLEKVCGGGDSLSDAQGLAEYGNGAAAPTSYLPGGGRNGGGNFGGNGFGGGRGAAGGGQEECKTFYESSCTTKYVEKQPGKFVGDTRCEKLPIELCGQGCTVQPGPEECHDKEITTVVDVPEEVCDLNPRKLCRTVTRLVPQLKPTHECTLIPQEVCQLKFTQPEEIDKPLMTKWCIDPNAEVVPDETYDDANSPAVIDGSAADPLAEYGNGNIPPPPPPPRVTTLPPTLYDAPPGAASNYAAFQDFATPDLPQDFSASNYQNSFAPPAPVASAYNSQSPSGYGAPSAGGYGGPTPNPASNGYGGPSNEIDDALSTYGNNGNGLPTYGNLGGGGDELPTYGAGYNKRHVVSSSMQNDASPVVGQSRQKMSYASPTSAPHPVTPLLVYPQPSYSYNV